MIAEATMQSPGMRSGARPPATPKLMMPRQPDWMVSCSKSDISWPRQTTSAPGPAAIRASKANPTSAITEPCDRSASSSVLSPSGSELTEAVPRPSMSISGLLHASRQASFQLCLHPSRQPWRQPVCGGETLKKVGHDQENLLAIIELSVSNDPLCVSGAICAVAKRL